jgi:hypothetical protein
MRAGLAHAGFDDDSAPILWGACDPVLPMPYAPVVAMVRALAGAPAGHVEALPRLQALLSTLALHLAGDAATELLALSSVLAELLGATDDATPDDDGLHPGPAHVPGAIGTHAVQRALVLVCEALQARGGGRPVVVVVTAAEAIDGPTRDLLAFLARRLARGVVVTLLSSSRLRLPQAFEEAWHSERVEVKPLPVDVARELAVAALGAPLDDEALGALVDKARGSPLALLQGIRFAIEGGLLRRRDDRWDATGLVARDLPAKLDRVLRARVERLPVDVRRVLGFAALLGRTFLPGALELVAVRRGLPRDDVTRAVSLLTEIGFLVAVARRPGAPILDGGDDAVPADELLAFEHPGVREVAGQSLEVDDARQAHAAAAEAMDVLLTSSAQALAPLRAHHLRFGDDVTRGARALVQAAERALHYADPASAQALLDDAATFAASDARVHVAFLLAQADAHGESHSEEAREGLRNLVRAANDLDDDELCVRASLRVVRFNLDVGDLVRASAAAECAFARAEREGVLPETLGVARHLAARVRLLQGDAPGAIAVLRSTTTARERLLLADAHLAAHDATASLEILLPVHELAHAAPDEHLRAQALLRASSALTLLLRLDDAHALAVEAARVWDGRGDDRGSARAHLAASDLAIALGDDVSAREHATAAHVAAVRSGRETLLRSAVCALARVALVHGDVATAEAWVEPLRRRVSVQDDPACTAHTSLLAARAKLLRAQSTTQPAARDRITKTALARGKEAVALAENGGDLVLAAQAMAVVGSALLLRDDVGGALAWAQRATEVIDEGRVKLHVDEVWVGYLHTLEALGDDDEVVSVRARVLAELTLIADRLPPERRHAFFQTRARVALRGDAKVDTQSPIVDVTRASDPNPL